MSITASEARQNLFPLIEQVNEDHGELARRGEPADAPEPARSERTRSTPTGHGKRRAEATPAP